MPVVSHFPWGYGVVLTNITRRQFDSSGLSSAPAYPSGPLQGRDDRVRGGRGIPEASLGHVQRSLCQPAHACRRWSGFAPASFPRFASVDKAYSPRNPSPRQAKSSSRLDLQVMDLQQEAIARGLGEGHRVIHGVAGSGKTLILAYRCEFLARTLTKPILVLVYNKALAAWLAHQMAARGLADRVSCAPFMAGARPAHAVSRAQAHLARARPSTRTWSLPSSRGRQRADSARAVRRIAHRRRPRFRARLAATRRADAGPGEQFAVASL